MNSTIPVNYMSIGSRPPKSWSMFTWAIIAAISVIVSYVMTLLLGLICLTFGLLLLVSMVTSGPSLGGAIIGVFALTIAATVFWSLIPRRQEFEPNGARIDLSSETRLRDEIEAIARTLNEKVPDEVYIVAIANAAVLQRGKRRVMLLGLPVLQLLSVSQFRAILAHEFGHYYGGDTRLSPWVFKARSRMAQVLMQLGGDSALLSLLSKWAIIAILRLVILGGLTLWWKLFNRVTQYISRQQEVRCDELACYLAGSENLEKGLCSVNLAAATFALYWNHVVTPVLAGGYRPQLGDGFARFMNAPAIAEAAASIREKQLAGTSTDPMDSHPGLDARVRKARALAIPAINQDDRLAVTLFEDLPWLELQLLSKLVPGLKPSQLRAMEWDTAATEVYIPLWRNQIQSLAPILSQFTVRTLVAAMERLSDIGNRIPDPPGTLLTREQRVERAAEAVGHALTLALVDHGWHLYLQPGQLYVQLDRGDILTPGTIIRELRSGSQTAATWLQYCEKNAIGAWPLMLEQPSAIAN